MVRECMTWSGTRGRRRAAGKHGDREHGDRIMEHHFASEVIDEIRHGIVSAGWECMCDGAEVKADRGLWVCGSQVGLVGRNGGC